MRSLSEHEVIAEFLRSEFHHPEFEEYRREFDRLVNHPTWITTGKMPCVGLCCFFAAARCGGNSRKTRNGSRWNLRRSDLARIRFFPRAQWRRVAEGSFYMTDMVESLRLKWQDSPDDEFFRKLRPHHAILCRKLVELPPFADRSRRSKPADHS